MNSLIKLSIISSLFLGNFVYGAEFSKKDLNQIFKSENTLKFSRDYKGHSFATKVKIWGFVKSDVMWMVGEVSDGYISCPVPLNITKYDSLKVGDNVMVQGKILNIGHSEPKKPALGLYVGCSFSEF